MELSSLNVKKNYHVLLKESISYISENGTLQFSAQALKIYLGKNFIPGKFMTLQETEATKKFLMFQETETPKKLLIFQEVKQKSLR